MLLLNNKLYCAYLCIDMIYLVLLSVTLLCRALESDDKNMISCYNHTNNIYDAIDSTSSLNTTFLMIATPSKNDLAEIHYHEFKVTTTISPTIARFNRIFGTNATTAGDIIFIFLIQLMVLLYWPVRYGTGTYAHVI